MKQFYHHPVMVGEVVEFLKPKPGGVYVDGTLGGGGHAAAVLRKCQMSNVKCQIIGIDQDDDAIKAAKKRLKRHAEFISASGEITDRSRNKFGMTTSVRDDLRPQVIFVHDNFRNLEAILDKLKISEVDGILLDLGVSSHQLDEPSRGFSFKEGAESVLDMRMDQRQKLAAYEVVNNYREEELRKIFFAYGEEKFSRQIAKEIVKRRREKQIKTPNGLVEIIKSATPPKYRFSRRGHFATKIFQALRIEVNDELGALRQVLPQAVERLKKGGRLVVISFHSLEDRIVKHFFREQKVRGRIEILTKKPLTPSPKEIVLNPRAESAKMRVVEKC